MYWHSICPKGNISIIPLQFFGCHSGRNLPNPSFIDYWAETRLRSHQGVLIGQNATKAKSDCLSNYSSSCRVRPMAVSLESWALNFPSVWVTGGQRGDNIKAKKKTTRTHRLSHWCKAPETSLYRLTAELQSQQSEACRSGPTCTACWQGKYQQSSRRSGLQMWICSIYRYTK